MIQYNFKNHSFIKTHLNIYLQHDGIFYKCKKCSQYLKLYKNKYYSFGSLSDMETKFLFDFISENIEKELSCDECIIKYIIK